MALATDHYRLSPTIHFKPGSRPDCHSAGSMKCETVVSAKETTRLLFMVIENFRGGDAKPIYRRLCEKGRMLPDGIRFVDSWVSADLRRCFQLMECDDAALFQRWTAEWSDLVEFEIVPLISGQQAAAKMTD